MSSRSPDPLCAMLRDLRHAAGLSLAAVEAQVGIPAVVLGSYERGDRQPKVKVLRTLLAFYGYQLDAVPYGTKTVRQPVDIATDLRAIADQMEAKLALSAVP